MNDINRGYWDAHPHYPHNLWRMEVENGETLSGYHDWVRARIAEDEDNRYDGTDNDPGGAPVLPATDDAQGLIGLGALLVLGAESDIWYEPHEWPDLDGTATETQEHIGAVRAAMRSVGAFIDRYQIEETDCGTLWFRLGGLHFRLVADGDQVRVQAFEHNDVDYGDPLLDSVVVRSST